ncbi:MAG: VOC family protein [Maribacter sp.]|uniref:bleomycin resistance protein n=1 Tax=Maribacter sp. TaxID=1897614 RepID=UPI003299AE19
MEHLQIAIPVLASLDIDRTVKFYHENLGFDRIGWKDKDYAVIARDKIEIHFWKCNDKIHPEHTSCYIRVKDVDGLYAEMKKAGVVHPNGALRDQPWRIREFAILDEDGNMIKFGENL